MRHADSIRKFLACSLFITIEHSAAKASRSLDFTSRYVQSRFAVYRSVAMGMKLSVIADDLAYSGLES